MVFEVFDLGFESGEFGDVHAELFHLEQLGGGAGGDAFVEAFGGDLLELQVAAFAVHCDEVVELEFTDCHNLLTTPQHQD